MKLSSRSRSENLPFAPAIGSPTMSTGWLMPLAPTTPAMSSLRVIENGVPVRMNVAPEICQPPSMFWTRLVGSRQNGRS